MKKLTTRIINILLRVLLAREYYPAKAGMIQLKKLQIPTLAWMITFLTMIRKILLTTLLIISFSSHSSAAENNFLDKHESDLTKIENYLNNIKTLKASFKQETPDKKITEGKLFLSRPGKMRIEYDESTPILIIVNGSVLAYSDLELDETSYLTTNSTPASFLTRKNFSFSATDVEITDFEKKNNLIKVGIRKKNKKEAGIFRLVFKEDPIEFVQMEVKNDLEETTKVYFTNSKFGERMNSKLFVVKNKNLPQ